MELTPPPDSLCQWSWQNLNLTSPKATVVKACFKAADAVSNANGITQEVEYWIEVVQKSGYFLGVPIRDTVFKSNAKKVKLKISLLKNGQKQGSFE